MADDSDEFDYHRHKKEMNAVEPEILEDEEG
eukprot:CAMPEP_0116914292 /NCGR_PEP_ID=MMETSP0467-20121206/17238_1 /TAXON_ID=283647 /ORGANISM="Mesodinium pulex, Strain SPMC105" /LENGTH=30 /DNA_ID= /DNA_START= /DNA_END= /DNA_ORIENTATION=